MSREKIADLAFKISIHLKDLGKQDQYISL